MGAGLPLGQDAGPEKTGEDVARPPASQTLHGSDVADLGVIGPDETSVLAGQDQDRGVGHPEAVAPSKPGSYEVETGVGERQMRTLIDVLP